MAWRIRGNPPGVSAVFPTMSSSVAGSLTRRLTPLASWARSFTQGRSGPGPVTRCHAVDAGARAIKHRAGGVVGDAARGAAEQKLIEPADASVPTTSSAGAWCSHVPTARPAAPSTAAPQLPPTAHERCRAIGGGAPTRPAHLVAHRLCGSVTKGTWGLYACRSTSLAPRSIASACASSSGRRDRRH